jgi:hypothetical protein
MTQFCIVLFTSGVILLVVGLMGRVKAKEVEVGTSNKIVRVVSGAIGVVFICLSIYLLYTPPVPHTPPVNPTPQTSPKMPTIPIPKPTVTPPPQLPDTPTPKPKPTDTPTRILTVTPQTVSTATPTTKEQLLLDEDFETGYDKGFETGTEYFNLGDEGKWNKLELGKDYSTEKGGATIKVVDCREYGREGNCVKISRTRTGSAYIYIILRKYSGTLRFEGMIRAENVDVDEKDYETGHFTVDVSLKSTSSQWEGMDGYRWHTGNFKGTFNWVHQTIDDVHVESHEAVKLRIGLQNTTGTVYVDDIKVYYLP